MQNNINQSISRPTTQLKYCQLWRLTCNSLGGFFFKQGISDHHRNPKPIRATLGCCIKVLKTYIWTKKDKNKQGFQLKWYSKCKTSIQSCWKLFQEVLGATADFFTPCFEVVDIQELGFLCSTECTFLKFCLTLMNSRSCISCCIFSSCSFSLC